MGNIALGTIATASSYVMPFAPSKAVDNDLNQLKRWVCNVTPGWLMLDLGKPAWINRWVVKNMGAIGFPSPDYNNRSYRLQGSSDNSCWNDIDTGLTENSADITDRTFGAVCYRYVRVYVDSGLRINKYLTSIAELEIYEAPNPYLRSLTISSGALNPAFSSTVFNYTADVGNDTGVITVTATADDPTSAIKVNGNTAASGQPYGPVNLNLGSNSISIEVTAASGLKQTYTVAVTRASSPYLTGISFSDGALAGTFAKTTLNYNANIGYDGSSITVTPTAEDANAGITVNGIQVTSGHPTTTPINLNVGVNGPITIVANSKEGVDSRTYTVIPTRASSPYLSGLLIDGVRNMNPAFNRAAYIYTASVANSKTFAQIRATAESGGNITVNSQPVQSGQLSQNIPLQAGANLVTVICNSATGSDFRKYEITITRAAQ